MITVKVHTDQHGLRNDIPLEQISEIIQQGNSLLWVDAINPTPEEFRLLGTEFAFHPLALEDAHRRHQRPKLDRYESFVFLVFYGLIVEEGHLRPHEVALFIGKNYLVTVHEGVLPAISDTADRWCDNVESLGNRGIGLLVYSLLDAIVDGYFPLIDTFAERVENLEEAIFASRHPGPHEQQEILRLKKDLLAVRRVLGPERDVMNLILRRESPLFDSSYLAYFQDVYDHILRVTEAVDSYRDLLTSALDAHLSMVSYRLNDVVKRLTSSSIILMSMTLIAGIYGMNFIHIPELDWQLGYAWALGLMLLIGGGLIVLFRRIDWL